MRDPLNKKETIAVMILQALICRKEIIRSTPMQAAKLAREYTDYLLDEIKGSNGNNLYYLPRTEKRF